MKLYLITVIGWAFLTSLSVQAQEQTNAKKSNISSSFRKEQDQIDKFKKRNAKVKSVNWKEGQIMFIEKTNGLVEKYLLISVTDRKLATERYGELPVPPPPPAPLPPATELPALPLAPSELLVPPAVVPWSPTPVAPIQPSLPVIETKK